MIEAIKKNKTEPQKIILFGSFTRGTEKEDSDNSKGTDPMANLAVDGKDIEARVEKSEG
ncbi:MAG TPA: nucleotidyltransferase domain-containing protein [Thermotogota bacterium]|nr:nucleotidyltransferase domain-containing protein [Thermotogota bacterium]HRW35628.1 nucleotidyltransferase domain-containing protein [Thermotogota bacterium]